MKTKRILAVLLAVIMMLGSVPVLALTTDTQPVVTASALNLIQLEENKVTVSVGEKYKLYLIGINGNYVSNSKIKWSSADKKIATVNSKGEVTGVAKGKTKITATYLKMKFTCTVTVVLPSIKAEAKSVAIGEPALALKLMAGSKDVTVKATWTSADKKIATVNSKGKVTPVKVGSVKITATYFGKKYSVTIKVEKSVKANVATVVKAYNSAVNKTKAQKNFTATYKNETTAVVVNMEPATLKSVTESLIAQFLKPVTQKYVFKNGKTSDGETPMNVIPLQGKKSAVKAEYVKVATSKKSGDNTVYTMTLITEKSTYKNGKSTAAPANESISNVVNIGQVDIEPAVIKSVTQNYTGTSVKATVNSKGLLTALSIYTPETVSIKGAMSVAEISAKLELENSDSWTFKY